MVKIKTNPRPMAVALIEQRLKTNRDSIISPKFFKAIFEITG